MLAPVAQSTVAVALVGNPNTGKSTLFSALVGIHQRVANYPGVTVERKAGRLEYHGRRYEVIDLPGLYSLAPRSRDEMVAVEVLLGRHEDQQPVGAVVCVVDAANLQRNLYLVSQVLEIGLPTVVALNMLDVASQRGIAVDARRSASSSACRWWRSRRNRRIGIADLKAALRQAVRQGPPHADSPLPEGFQREAARLERMLAGPGGSSGAGHASPRFLAQRLLLDGNGYLQNALLAGRSEMAAELTAARQRLAEAGCKLPDVETTARYDWAARVLQHAVVRCGAERPTASDRIDRLLTHRLWGTVVLGLMMACMFQAVFAGAEPVQALIARGLDAAGKGIETVMAAGALRSLLTGGIIDGVGSVLTFLPQIALLFFFIAVLEDSGYMARAACLMDRVMARVGLSGKSVLPMLSSFGCAVPAIMGARVVENERDRLTTILVTPLLTCPARLQVYVLISALIPSQKYLGGWVNLQGLIVVGLYGLGILAAVAAAWVLKHTLLAGRADVLPRAAQLQVAFAPHGPVPRGRALPGLRALCGDVDPGRFNPYLGSALLSRPGPITAAKLPGPGRAPHRAGRAAAGLGLAHRLRRDCLVSATRSGRGYAGRDLQPRGGGPTPAGAGRHGRDEHAVGSRSEKRHLARQRPAAVWRAYGLVDHGLLCVLLAVRRHLGRHSPRDQ